MRAIAAFKFVKATLLIVGGIGAFVLIGRDGPDVLEWIWRFNVPMNADVAAKVSSLQGKRIEELAAAMIVYGVLFSIEGTGLALARRWGEWVTVFITGSFLPVEAWELARHPSIWKGLTLVANAAILAYLIWRIATTGREREAATA